jgi:predicted dehydrogenase
VHRKITTTPGVLPPARSTRRHFLKATGAAGFAFPFVASGLRASPPSSTLRHASIGGGGMAGNDIKALASNPWVKVVAFADVDVNRIGEVREMIPEARYYQDWRQLLERESGQIDSVNVSVPDHMHAPIALSAMQLGKHCYCQKPLAHDIHETRVLARFARERRLVTQMGIQNHSIRAYRQAVALVQQGVIGRVREVHSWSSKKWGDVGPAPTRADPIPPGLDWDLWLGAAASRPYVKDHYHPGNWRKRLDFGTGTFGDMGCHILDPVFNALALTAPISVRSDGPAPDAWNWPIDARIRYVFPGTRFTVGRTISVTWYDGDARLPAEVRALLPAGGGVRSPVGPAPVDSVDQGSLFVGTEGVLHLPHPAAPRLHPEQKYRGQRLPEVEHGHHWTLWAEACRSGGSPSAGFDYSGPLTEMVLLGSVAVRFPQTTLNWDSGRLQFSNESAANRFLRRTYRQGWEVAGL